MQICQNPICPNPFNINANKFCINCGLNSFDSLFKNRYRIYKILGEGGFGKTYEAQDIDRLDAPCVVKQFLPQVQGTEAFAKAAQMFKEEAKRLFELGENHPQIPRLVAYFEQGRNLYLVQEFIPGETLVAELNRQGFGEGRIRDLLTDLLPVLQFIHERNVIHRDIKPENIIRRQSDHKLVLIDFGGAKQVTQTTLARQGTSIYTVGYAPLEQMQGYACPASDLYALGATCVRLLTGYLPSQDTYGNIFDPLYDAMNACWLWRECLKEKGVTLSDQLGQILDKLLQHSVKLRYQSAREVLEDLHKSNSSVPPTITSNSQSNIQNASLAYILNGQSNIIRSLAFSSDQLLYSGGDDKKIRIWNLKTRKLQGILPENGDWVVVAISQDGQTLVSGSSNKTIKVWNINTGKIQRIFQGHFDLINSLAISSDSKILVSGSRDKTIRIWQLDTGNLLQTISGQTGYVYTVCLSPDGQYFASGGSDKVIKIWQLPTGELLYTLTGSPGFIRALAISSNLKILASSGYGNKIYLWNLRTGQLQQFLDGHQGCVQSLTISPDGNSLISGSDDRTIKIWSLQTGKLLTNLTGHTGSILSTTISPDGKTLATGGNDKTIRIWQLLP